MTRNTFVPLAAALLLAAGCSFAGAATMTHSFSIPYTGTDWTQYLSVPQFDPALGILNSVTFEMPSATLKSWVTAANTKAGATQTTRYVMAYSLDSAAITLKGPDGATLIAGDWGSHSIVYNTATRVAVPWGQTAVVNAGPYTTSGTYTAPPPASYLTAFTGTGTVALPVQTALWFTFGGSSNWETFSISTQAKADFNIIYDYTVPEPGSMMALLGGLAAFGGLLIRKSK
jgi:hypothetical protein